MGILDVLSNVRKKQQVQVREKSGKRIFTLRRRRISPEVEKSAALSEEEIAAYLRAEKNNSEKTAEYSEAGEDAQKERLALQQAENRKRMRQQRAGKKRRDSSENKNSAQAKMTGKNPSHQSISSRSERSDGQKGITGEKTAIRGQEPEKNESLANGTPEERITEQEKAELTGAKQGGTEQSTAEAAKAEATKEDAIEAEAAKTEPETTVWEKNIQEGSAHPADTEAGEHPAGTKAGAHPEDAEAGEHLAGTKAGAHPEDAEAGEHPAGTEDSEFFKGLTSEEVRERIELGMANTPVDTEEVTLRDIVRENVFTYFNLIFLVIAICLCLVGSYRNLTFLPIIVANTLIGIVQEWKSRRMLERLTIMSAPTLKTVRDGRVTRIPSETLVLDDLVIFEAGNQIPADAVVVSGEVTVNESLLTGEADEIVKQTGDHLLSGSFIVSGSCRATLEKVGADSYVSRLTLEAKTQKKGEDSEMIRSLDRLVKIVGIIIVPIGAALMYQQLFINHETIKDSVTGTAAAILGMIPEGLYLLASVAMAVSAMRLAMNKVLIHNMKSIETLARSDVLCVDKTGTITDSSMTVHSLILMNETSILPVGTAKADIPAAGKGTAGNPYTGQNIESRAKKTILEQQIGDFAACMKADNITMEAVKERFTRRSGKKPDSVFSFSSTWKYSGAVFGQKNYVLGAPEFVLRDAFEKYRPEIEKHTSLGYRVLVFGEYEGILDGKALRAPVKPLGLILLENPVRKEAPETFRYFAEQGVIVKVISGDSPLTVSEVAMQAGIEHADLYVDASTLKESDLDEACEKYTVFGRVTPQQKRQLIAALKRQGHTVAMTGDGVNDVLALKDADCSIAMASGSDAAEHAAQMVLLESDFSRMPSVVAEGRRVANNIERTASLFLVKNIFSLLMSVFSIIFLVNYPLEPSQVSLISMFTIGIPAFVMSLEPNARRLRGKFLSNVFFKALPAGLTDFAVISALVIFCREFEVNDLDLSTSCTILLAIVGIMILYRISSPMTRFHWILWLAMIFGILFCMTFMNKIFAISNLSGKSAMLLVLFAIVTEPVLRYLSLAIRRIWQVAEWYAGRLRKVKERQKNDLIRMEK